MSHEWRSGNQLRLLENGEEYFPRVFDAIRTSQQEVIIETFILFEDEVGKGLHQCILDASLRGVKIMLTADGYGTPYLSPGYVNSLTAAGVRVQIFDPKPRLFGVRTNLFRRLHRKLVVIDGARAFLGGINFSDEHLKTRGPDSKQDYAVEITGPVVQDIHRFALSAFINYGHRNPWKMRKFWQRKRNLLPTYDAPRLSSRDADVLFVIRDNDDHKDDIEEQYLQAIRHAKSRIVIANAYFFPGYRLFKVLCNAARRGLDVRLILQGESDVPLSKTASTLLYEHLLEAGIHLYEYCDRHLHGKVAVVDDEWATIGSSNLDPLSLSFNLEANIIVRNHDFNAALHEKLHTVMTSSCKELERRYSHSTTLWRVLISFFVFHFLRHFPSWAVMLPARPQKIRVQAIENASASRHQ